MLKKSFGIICLILGVISILAGFVFINKIISQNNLTISHISILVNTLLLGLPAIIIGLKFIDIDQWEKFGGIITIIISGMHVIYLLVNLFYIRELPENMILVQCGVAISLLIYGWFMKNNKIN